MSSSAEPPQLEVLKRTFSDSLAKADIDWLTVMTEADYTGQSPFNLMVMERSDLMQFWNLPVGMLVTKVNQHPGGKELYVWGYAGKSVMTNRHEIRRDLHRIARIFGCKWLAGLAIHEALSKIYERKFKMHKVGDYFVEEIQNALEN